MSTLSKQHQLAKRRRRIRSVVTGTAERPRLSVTFSNVHVQVQLIDDVSGKTVVALSSAGQKLPANLSQRAEWAGTEIAKKAQAAKIKSVVLDRRGKPYHGRVKALAEAARKSGLEF